MAIGQGSGNELEDFATAEAQTEAALADGSAPEGELEVEALEQELLPPGFRVGDYEIERQIGAGGFGRVYAAIHPVIGKRVAIKVLSRACSANPVMVSRFVAEARAVNQIRHRNIVDIFALGALTDGRQYLIMELLDGVPFSLYLRRQGPLQIGEALPLLRGIARAVDAAHATGIIHRDLKPENVFLIKNEEGELVPKLLDFGIAKLLGPGAGLHRTHTGMPIGTPAYMSPEQCHGHAVNHRTDIYSYGVMIFRVLTGQLPFHDRESLQVMIGHTTQPPPRPSLVANWLPAELDGPILRMLSKEPADRPETMIGAYEQLREAAAQAGILVTSTSPSEMAMAASIQAAQQTPASDRASAPSLLAGPGTFPGEQVLPPSLAATDLSLSTSGSTRPARPWRLPLAMAVILLLLAGGGYLAWRDPVPPDPALQPIGPRPLELTSVSKPAGELPTGMVLAAGSGPPATGQPAPDSFGSAAPDSSGRAAPDSSGSASSENPSTGIAPPPERAVPAATVEITVQSTPPDCKVYLAGTLLGSAPGPFVVPRSDEPLRLDFRAKGYTSSSVRIRPVANAIVPVQLLRAGPTRPKPLPTETPAELEDPFGPE